MSTKTKLLSFLLLISTISFAQNTVVKGSIKDNESKSPIENAVVMLLHPKDSVIIAFCRTSKNGDFELNSNQAGDQILLITHPLYAEYIDDINLNKSNNIPSIKLTSKSKLLETIIVKSGGAMKIKGDTTIYTADSFNVSANANVEELLKKLPGIQVDKNGDIKAMGEKVEKVLVDGEEFFGDDPGMAVKNLRADAVKEVQVFDKKSDQATFTGIDDGKTQKTINLKLKEDKKKGYFGKISSSGGPANDVTNRFNNNLMFGSFKGKRKFSAFLLNGNTGQDGLSWQDRNKYGGTDDQSFEMYDEDGIFSFSFSNIGGDEEVNINTQNGFIRNINAGLQYSNKWNDKHNLNFSPKYNLQDYSNINTNHTVTQLGDSVLNQNATTTNNTYRYNIKNSLTYDFKIDTSNSLKVTVKANYYNTESSDLYESSTIGGNEVRKNSSTRITKLNYEKNALTSNLLFKHKFNKARRTLSISTDYNSIATNSSNKLISDNVFYNLTDSLAVKQDQISVSDKSSAKISSKATYTEPLNKKWSMEMAYELGINKGINNQSTFEVDSSTNTYTKEISLLSNNFDQTITTHTPSAKFSFNYKKTKLNFGSGIGITNFDLLDKTKNIDYIRKYTNFFPNATFVYTYKSNHTFRINYKGYNTQPTINQLQPLVNNNNLFSKYVGNPYLKPSFSNSLSITNNGYVFLKNMWNYQNLNVTYTQNSITNNRTINAITGNTETQPINTDGNISISSWAGVGFKHKKTDVDVQLNIQTSYSRFADVINSQKSFSNTANGGFDFTLNKSKKDKYDISVSNTYSYNYNKNAQSATTNKFLSTNLNVDGTIYYKKEWSLTTNYEYIGRGKINAFIGHINNHLVNLRLQKTFKKNEFTVFVKVQDLLNQNISIDRYFYANTFVEDENQRLKRYYLLGFAWDFKNKSSK